MSNRNRGGGFSSTHETCRCPRKEQKCFSVFADDQASGFCFACSQTIRGTHKPCSIERSTAIPTIVRTQQFVTRDLMIDSIASVVDAVESFANIEGHREAISDYGHLRADGLDHLTAARASGYRAIAESWLPEIRGKINRLPTYFREMIQSTYVPDILSAFNVGISQHGATQFWIVDGYGRICNTQEVFYNGLSRQTDRQLRYKYRTIDGYVVSAFFGAEQLQTGSHSWTQRAFDRFAMIVVVESPKSAMLASILYPNVIWLAACGASGITPTKAQSLRGREVRILFDNDQAGTDGARKGLNVLREAGAFAQIVAPTVFFGGSRPEGWDVGDEALMIFGGQS